MTERSREKEREREGERERERARERGRERERARERGRERERESNKKIKQSRHGVLLAPVHLHPKLHAEKHLVNHVHRNWVY